MRHIRHQPARAAAACAAATQPCSGKPGDLTLTSPFRLRWPCPAADSAVHTRKHGSAVEAAKLSRPPLGSDTKPLFARALLRDAWERRRRTTADTARNVHTESTRTTRATSRGAGALAVRPLRAPPVNARRACCAPCGQRHLCDYTVCGNLQVKQGCARCGVAKQVAGHTHREARTWLLTFPMPVGHHN